MDKVGLILEGGGMRGIYTAGVLDFFIDKNIEVDLVVGVSAGGCHAASYLSNNIIEPLELILTICMIKNILVLEI